MADGAATHCPYCALQCAMTLTAPAVPAAAAVPARPAEAPLEVAGRDFPTNRGGLCRKGWTSASLLEHPGRVTEPLLQGRRRRAPPGQLGHGAGRSPPRRSGTPAPRTGRTPSGCSAAAGSPTRRPTSWASSPGWRCGTSRIDYNGRFCMSSAAAAGMRAFGLDRGLPFPLADLDTASTILLLGSNVAETMPPFVQHLQGARDAGGLIVVDPRRSATAAFTADGGGLHLQPLPGTDLALLLGLAHVVIHEGLGGQRLHRGAHHRLRRPWPAASPPTGPSACSPSPGSRPG